MTRLRRRSSGHALAGFLGLLLLLAPPASADAEDTFSIVAGVNQLHDDNLFRLSSSADPQTVLGKSTKADDITVSSLAFKVNKPYSLQKFEFEVSLIDYRYRNFSYLSYSTQPYKAAWRWSVTPSLHGNLTTERTQSLNSFADYTGYTTRNTHVDERTRFDGVLDLSASWHLLAGVAQSTSTNSQVTLGQSNSRVNTAEAGVRHTFPSGSALSYIVRNGRGDYFNRPDPLLAGLSDNRFDDRLNELRLLWALTGKASVDTRLAHFQRTHAHYAMRDFGGNTGSVNLNWSISGKSFLTASAARELGSYQTFSSSYTTTDRLTLSPYWQFGAKTALRARYDYARRDYLGAIAATPANNRSDTLRTAMIALEWQPLRSLSVSGSLQSETRASNQPGLDYRDKTLGLTAQLTF